MEHKYLSIFSTAKQNLANISCGILEDHAIPVMMERVQLQHEGRWVTGYRVRVPEHRSTRAMELLECEDRLQYQLIIDTDDADTSIPSIMQNVQSVALAAGAESM